MMGLQSSHASHIKCLPIPFSLKDGLCLHYPSSDFLWLPSKGSGNCSGYNKKVGSAAIFFIIHAPADFSSCLWKVESAILNVFLLYLEHRLLPLKPERATHSTNRIQEMRIKTA
jgi:hypothetical protein